MTGVNVAAPRLADGAEGHAQGLDASTRMTKMCLHKISATHTLVWHSNIRVPQLPGLAVLDLCCCGLGDIGVKALAEAFTAGHARLLVKIDLRFLLRPRRE